MTGTGGLLGVTGNREGPCKAAHFMGAWHDAEDAPLHLLLCAFTRYLVHATGQEQWVENASEHSPALRFTAPAMELQCWPHLSRLVFRLSFLDTRTDLRIQQLS